MMLDALLQFSAAQPITATAVSTNTVDLSVARDMAPGTPLYAVFGVDVAATSAGASTVTFEIISSAAADLSSPDVLASSGPIPKADLTAGRRLIGVGLNPAALLATPNGRRYLGVRYTIGTGPLTAGSFSAYLTNHLPPGNQTYASGYTVF